jgi:hypothetical protein
MRRGGAVKTASVRAKEQNRDRGYTGLRMKMYSNCMRSSGNTPEKLVIMAAHGLRIASED